MRVQVFIFICQIEFTQTPIFHPNHQRERFFFHNQYTREHTNQKQKILFHCSFSKTSKFKFNQSF